MIYIVRGAQGRLINVVDSLENQALVPAFLNLEKQGIGPGTRVYKEHAVVRRFLCDSEGWRALCSA